MPQSFQSTIKALDLVFRDYRTKGDPEFLKLAPVVMGDVNGNYQVYTDVARLDDSDAPTRGSDGANFKPKSFDLNHVQYHIERLIGHSDTLPYSVIEAIDKGGNIDILDGAIARVARPLFGVLVQEFVANSVATLAAPTAGAAGIVDPGFHYVDYMQKAMDEIELATGGYRPNKLYVGPTVANKLRLLDEVQAMTAIAGYTDEGSAVRRTGMVTNDALALWHQVQLGLDLVIERQSAKIAGNAAFIVGNYGVLSYSGEGTSEGCFKTFSRGNNPEMGDLIGDMVRVILRENGPGKAPGIGIDAHSFVKTITVAPEMGRSITFTTSA